MKTTKKLASLILSVVMLLSLCMAAGADETENTATTYTITIDGADAGHTYEAYQIFKGKLAGNVLTEIELGTGVAQDVLTFDGTTYTTATELADVLTKTNVDAFMAHVSKYLRTPAGSSTEEISPYSISGLEPGYYLIKDQDNSVPDGGAYTKFIAKIVKDTNATPKTDKTTHEKKVLENVKPVSADGATPGYTYGECYNDVADYNIGDTVPFALYSKVPDLTNFTHYEMIFHDQMSAGLEFDPSSVKVTVDGKQLSADADFTVDFACEDGCTFHVKINELAGQNYATGAGIRVDFTAVLNDQAVIGLDGNPNQSRLEFSNNPNDITATTSTEWDYVVVFTYELDLKKIDGEKAVDENGNEVEIPLQGAEFTLQNAAGDYVILDEEGRVTSWTEEKEQASVLISDEQGNFKVVGLDDGTYTLTETKAPEGYNLLGSSIEIIVKATTTNDHNYAADPERALTALEIKVDAGAFQQGTTDDGTVNAVIENNKGATLPETGGIGTTIFYVAGGMLVLLAVVLLVTKRRMGENN